MWWFAVDNSARVVVPVSNMRDLMLWRMAVGPDRGGGKSARAGSLYGGGKVGHRVWLELIKMRVFLVWNSTAKSIFHMYVVFPPAQTNRALIPGLVRASSGAGWVTRVLKVYWAVAEEKKKGDAGNRPFVRKT